MKEGIIHEDEFIQHQITPLANRIYVLDEVVETVTLSPQSVMRRSFSRENLALARARALRTRYQMEKGFYNYALYNFGFGTRTLLIGHKELSDSKSKEEISELYKEFKHIAKDLSKHVNLPNKVRLLLFRTNMDLYGIVRSLMRA